MSVNEEIASEIQRLDPSSIIELFELDCTELGGEIFRFHNGTNKLMQNLVWQGEEYIRFPIQVTGFETSGQGQFPRPIIAVSNVMSAITTIILEFDDLINAKFTRKRTLLKYLDVVNFPGGVNPTADPDVFLPDDVFYVDRKSIEDRDQVQFELASVADLQGVQCPKRTVNQGSCTWAYRSPECSYVGIPLYDANDDQIPPPTSAEAIAMMDAYADLLQAQQDLADAQTALAAASDAMTAASIYTVTTEFEYDVSPKYYVQVTPFGTGAIWNDVAVSLGTLYTKGAFQETIDTMFGPLHLYAINENVRDEGAYTAAVAAYNAAVIARDDAEDDLVTAQNTFDAALAAVPLDDQVYKDDICGKRLTSCKLRFGENNPLPFGGFPGVSR